MQTEASKAGLTVLSFIDAPIAAAAAADIHLSVAEKLALIVDYGAKALRVSLLKAYNGEIELLGTAKNEQIGGKKIDKMIFKNVIGEFSGDETKYSQLLQQCDIAKISLIAS